MANQPGQNLMFGSLSRDVLNNGAAGNALDQSLYRRNDNRFLNSIEVNENLRGNHTVLRAQTHERSSTSNDRMKLGDGGSNKAAAPPPGFLSDLKDVRRREPGHGRRASDVNGDKGKGSSGQLYKADRLANQLDYPGLPAGSSLRSASTSEIEESMKQLHADNDEENKANNDGSEMDDLENQVDSLGIEDETGEKKDKKKHHRDKVILYFCVFLLRFLISNPSKRN